MNQLYYRMESKANNNLKKYRISKKRQFRLAMRRDFCYNTVNFYE